MSRVTDRDSQDEKGGILMQQKGRSDKTLDLRTSRGLKYIVLFWLYASIQVE